MDRKTAADFRPEVLTLFDEYVHGQRDRRGFLAGAARLTGSVAGAELLLAELAPNYALAQQVARDDARIVTRKATFASPLGHGSVSGLLAQPAGAKQPPPAILVVHENRGLNPYIEDVARRLAVEGYIAFAPDVLASLGGYAGDDDRARELFAKLDPARMRADFLAAAQALKTLPGASGKVGAIGFCYGGGIVNYVATQMPDLDAAVPFYGAQPSAEEAARIRSPMMLHYAGADERTNAGWPKFEAALKAAHVDYQAFTYPGAQHGFHNDTTPRYDAEAAKLSWQRSMDFFSRHLRG